jgi:hypothetical protein
MLRNAAPDRLGLLRNAALIAPGAVPVSAIGAAHLIVELISLRLTSNGGWRWRA